MNERLKARRSVARNRRAFHDYSIEDRIEAGLVLAGTEVKSLRVGKANIAESYASPQGDELYLINASIQAYSQANRFNHETKRPRKLLLRRREIDKLLGAVKRKGMTLVPLSLYFSPRGFAKVELGLARGKKEYDKRHAERDRDWQRDKERLMRHSARDS